MAIDLNRVMADLGVEEKFGPYYEEDEAPKNQNFIEARERRRASERLLFESGKFEVVWSTTLSLLGASKKDRFAKIVSQCQEVEGTEGGVLVQKEEYWDEPGVGEPIGAICNRFEKMKTTDDEWFGEVSLGEILKWISSFFMDTSKIFLGLHYAAYLKDELDKGPFDYTFSRNERVPEEFYMRNATLLPGLELGIEKLKCKAQVGLFAVKID